MCSIMRMIATCQPSEHPAGAAERHQTRITMPSHRSRVASEIPRTQRELAVSSRFPSSIISRVSAIAASMSPTADSSSLEAVWRHSPGSGRPHHPRRRCRTQQSAHVIPHLPPRDAQRLPATADSCRCFVGPSGLRTRSASSEIWRRFVALPWRKQREGGFRRSLPSPARHEMLHEELSRSCGDLGSGMVAMRAGWKIG